MRKLLMKHLEDEIDHADLLQSRLNTHRLTTDPTRFRPLPTTVAFNGAIREVAVRNWKAYVLALAYLQLSLDTESPERHEYFYDQVLAADPSLDLALSGMREHDEEDTGLGHRSDVHDLLESLVDRHLLTSDDVVQARLVAHLSWSFLDGILQHYRGGDLAIVQRAGLRVV